MTYPLCRDCRHWRPTVFGREFGQCAAFPQDPVPETRPDLIDGSAVRHSYEYAFCSVARGDFRSATDCGPSGTAYEPERQHWIAAWARGVLGR